MKARMIAVKLEECLRHYQKALEYLEEEQIQITQGLQSDLLDAYRETVLKEINELTEKISQLKALSILLD